MGWNIRIEKVYTADESILQDNLWWLPLKGRKSWPSSAHNQSDHKKVFENSKVSNMGNICLYKTMKMEINCVLNITCKTASL